MSDPTLQDLPLDRLICPPQVRERFDDELLAGLAKSMGEVGLQQPIRVRSDGDRWSVIDGARRVRAARLAGWTSIAAIVEAGEPSEAEVIQRQLVANCQRADLTPIETARAIDRLMKETRWSGAQVASKLGISPATVSKLLALLVLPEEVQKRVHEGKLAASTAYEIAKTREPGERAALTAEAKQGRLTRDQASARSRGRRGGRAGLRTGGRTRARLPRACFTLDGGSSVAVSARELTLPAVVSWLEQLLDRLRPLAADGLSLDDARRRLTATGRSGSDRDAGKKEAGDA